MRQASCDAGVATSLNPSHYKASTTKLSEQKRYRNLSLAGDPFCITHLEFASVVQPLKEQSLTDHGRRQPLPQHLLWHSTTSLSKITCPAQFSSSYKHFTLLQLLSWSWDSQAELFSGLPHTNSIQRVRNMASNSTFPWEKKPVKITSLNELNHLTLRVQVTAVPWGLQSKRERPEQHESGKIHNFSTLLQFQCSLMQDQLWLPVWMQLRERGKDMISAKK